MEYEKHGTYQTASESFAEFSLSVVEMITFDLSFLSFICWYSMNPKPKIRRRTDNSVAWEEIKRHELTAMLTDQNSSKTEKRSWSLYASRTTKVRTQMSSLSTEQSRAAAWSYFWSQKCVGSDRLFEIGVHCAFENLAWPRHFTSQRLPTQHCSGRPSSFNHSKLEA